MCRLVGPRGEGRGREGWNVSPRWSHDSTSPRTRLSYETKRAMDPRRDGWGVGCPRKKRAGLYFPLTSERKRRSWSTRSSTNCLRGTGLGINLLLAPRPPLCLFALFPPIVFFIPNFTRRHATFGWGHCAAARKNFVEFRFAVTNASC